MSSTAVRTTTGLAAFDLAANTLALVSSGIASPANVVTVATGYVDRGFLSGFLATVRLFDHGDVYPLTISGPGSKGNIVNQIAGGLVQVGGAGARVGSLEQDAVDGDLVMVRYLGPETGSPGGEGEENVAMFSTVANVSAIEAGGSHDPAQSGFADVFLSGHRVRTETNKIEHRQEGGAWIRQQKTQPVTPTQFAALTERTIGQVVPLLESDTSDVVTKEWQWTGFAGQAANGWVAYEAIVQVHRRCDVLPGELIQDAVDAAVAPATITVCAANYAETVTLPDMINLDFELGSEVSAIITQGNNSITGNPKITASGSSALSFTNNGVIHLELGEVSNDQNNLILFGGGSYVLSGWVGKATSSGDNLFNLNASSVDVNQFSMGDAICNSVLFRVSSGSFLSGCIDGCNFTVRKSLLFEPTALAAYDISIRGHNFHAQDIESGKSAFKMAQSVSHTNRLSVLFLGEVLADSSQDDTFLIDGETTTSGDGNFDSFLEFRGPTMKYRQTQSGLAEAAALHLLSNQSTGTGKMKAAMHVDEIDAGEGFVVFSESKSSSTGTRQLHYLLHGTKLISQRTDTAIRFNNQRDVRHNVEFSGSCSVIAPNAANSATALNATQARLYNRGTLVVDKPVGANVDERLIAAIVDAEIAEVA